MSQSRPLSRSLVLLSLAATVFLAACGQKPAPAPAAPAPAAPAAQAPATPAPAAPKPAAPAQPKIDFPKDAVRIMATHASGGSVDLGVRTVQKFLEKALGGTVLVENLTGGGGNRARATVFDAKPDGHTLLVTFQPSMSVGQIWEAGDFKSDEFVGLGTITFGDGWPVLVAKNLPVSNMKELVEYSQKTPVNIGFSGLGGGTHLMALTLINTVGIKGKVVPFDSGAQASAALAGGHVQVVPTATTNAMPFIKDGSAKVVGLFGESEPELLPDAKRLMDQGYNTTLSQYLAIYAPPKTPPAVAEILTAALKTAVTSPEYIAAAKKAGLRPAWYGPEELKKLDAEAMKLANDTVKFKQ